MNQREITSANIRTTEAHLEHCAVCSLELERSTAATERLDALVLGETTITERDVHQCIQGNRKPDRLPGWACDDQLI